MAKPRPATSVRPGARLAPPPKITMAASSGISSGFVAQNRLSFPVPAAVTGGGRGEREEDEDDAGDRHRRLSLPTIRPGFPGDLADNVTAAVIWPVDGQRRREADRDHEQAGASPGNTVPRAVPPSARGEALGERGHGRKAAEAPPTDAAVIAIEGFATPWRGCTRAGNPAQAGNFSADQRSSSKSYVDTPVPGDGPSGGFEARELLTRQGHIQRGDRVADGLGSRRSRDRNHHWRLGEHPGQRHLLWADPVVACHLRERGEPRTQLGGL